MDALRVPCIVDAGRLLLRPWSPADAAQIEAAAADPEISSWNPINAPAEQWCAVRADWSDGTHASWAVVHVDDSATVVGGVSLHHIDHAQLDSEIGYWVAPAQGR